VANVEVNVPDNMAEIIMSAVQRRTDAALSVTADVPRIIKDKAILDEKDAYGNSIQHKQPKPAKSPKNFPNLQLVQTGEMMSNDRWTTNRVSSTEVQVVYSPTDYFQYVIEKRPWITPEKVNAEAWSEIQSEMTKRFKEGSD